MRTFKSLFLLFTVAMLSPLACKKGVINPEFGAEKLFYYYRSEKIYLQINPNIICLSLYGQYSTEVLRSVLRDGEILQEISRIGQNDLYYYTEIRFDHPLTNTGIKEAMERFAQIPNVQMVFPGLKTVQGDAVGLSNRFYVKLRSETDFLKMSQLSAKYNINIVERIGNTSSYVLACDRTSKLNSLDAANLFHEKSYFVYSEPEFVFRLTHF